MIVRMDVRSHTRPFRYWQILEFQVTMHGTVHVVSQRLRIHHLRFGGIADCVRYARVAIFYYLERRLTEIPDHFEWRIYDQGCPRTCPVCHEPMHQTIQLRARLAATDVSHWTCADCERMACPHREPGQSSTGTVRV
jgi:hypothetical protein